MNAPLSALEHATGELLVEAARLVRAVRRLDQQLDADVPAAALRALSVLDEQGELSVGRLAEADRTSQPAASALVAGLVERGWVERRPDPADRRGRLVALTDEGRARLGAVRRQHATALAAALTDDATPDVRAATRLVRDLLAHDLSPPGTDAAPTSTPSVPEGTS